jgi:hypothetical protein
MTPELTAAVDLIKLAGGRVHFSKPEVVVWGQTFKNLREVSLDPRCEVSYLTIFNRLRNGSTLDEAVQKYTTRTLTRQITCWGEVFSSIRKLALDSRCKVCYNIVAQKLREGKTPEEATSDARIKLVVEPVVEPTVEVTPNV